MHHIFRHQNLPTRKVLFLPFDTNVPELLAAMDFFLLPSLWEGLPVTAIESQCAGVPIFISDSV